MIKHLLTDPEILNIYRRGSVVYGTNNVNSDADYIIVTINNYKPILITPDLQYFTITEFDRALYNQDIVAIECMFLSPEHRLKSSYVFTYTLDKGRLRESISTITNNSWCKGKKKLTITDDLDVYIGLKSIFHSIRILDYAIQLADYREIRYYKRVNYIWEELYNLMQEDIHHTVLWELVQAKYYKVYRAKSTEFKKLCPKDNIPDHKLKQDLIKLFEENNCYSPGVIESKLITKIISLVNNL